MAHINNNRKINLLVEGVEFIVSEDLLKEGTLYFKGLLSS